MERQLPTISILHYVYGAFTCLLGLGMLVFIGVGSLLNSDLVQNSNDAPPEELGAIIQGLGWVLFAIVETIGVLIIASGGWIAKRRNRMISLIIAGFCCLSFPLGTALGVYTLVVLLNPDVQKAYAEAGLRSA